MRRRRLFDGAAYYLAGDMGASANKCNLYLQIFFTLITGNPAFFRIMALKRAV